MAFAPGAEPEADVSQWHLCAALPDLWHLRRSACQQQSPPTVALWIWWNSGRLPRRVLRSFFFFYCFFLRLCASPGASLRLFSHDRGANMFSLKTSRVAAWRGQMMKFYWVLAALHSSALFPPLLLLLPRGWCGVMLLYCLWRSLLFFCFFSFVFQTARMTSHPTVLNKNVSWQVAKFHKPRARVCALTWSDSAGSAFDFDELPGFHLCWKIVFHWYLCTTKCASLITNVFQQ